MTRTRPHSLPLAFAISVLALSGCGGFDEEYADAVDHELPDLPRAEPLPSAEEIEAELGSPEASVAGTCPQLRVINTGGARLNVRTGASSTNRVVGLLDAGERVKVLQSHAAGQNIQGTTMWYEVDAGIFRGWVSAAFAACECGRVKVVNTGGATLRARQTPSTTSATVGFLGANESVRVVRIVDNAQAVAGNKRWYEVDAGVFKGFISAAFSTCQSGPPPGYLLPIACGRSAVVTQGNNSPFSHNGAYGRFSFDFRLNRGTPLHAMQDGVVVASFGGTTPTSPCWAGGGPACINAANHVVLHHNDGTQTAYVHLDSPAVRYGQTVKRGQLVGLSGGTGYSTGPHAHVQRQTACPESVFCPNVGLRFADAGIPTAGQTVTSQNCQ